MSCWKKHNKNRQDVKRPQRKKECELCGLRAKQVIAIIMDKNVVKKEDGKRGARATTRADGEKRDSVGQGKWT